MPNSETPEYEMNTQWIAFSFSFLLGAMGTAYAQSTPGTSPDSASLARVENGIPISHLIATVAKKTGKKFVIDPSVHGDAAIVGQDAANISYNDLLTILHAYGYTAAEYGGYVNVVPETKIRQQPVPEVSGKDTRPDAEFVSKVITVKSAPAAQLVPILRPLLPQAAHLAALPCANKLIIVDTFANVRRVQAIIDALDVGEPFPAGKCSPHEDWMTPGPTSLPAAPRDNTVEHR
jgi:general secretion pathway protein D